MGIVSSALAIEGYIEPWARARGLAFHHDPLTGDGAVFSACEQYRPLLWRRATVSVPFLGLGMLNPSTARHDINDPTITRGIGRAVHLRLAGPLVWNLFDHRATDPDDMKAAASPSSEHNDAAIDLALTLSAMTIAGWGTHGAHRDRQRQVLRRCAVAKAQLHALKLTKDGFPGHPLYIGNAVQPSVWEYDF